MTLSNICFFLSLNKQDSHQSWASLIDIVYDNLTVDDSDISLLPTLFPSSLLLLYAYLMDLRLFSRYFPGTRRKLKAMEKTERAEHSAVISFLHLLLLLLRNA